MRILCISTYFLPYLSGLTVYPHRLFKYLATKKNSVQVVTLRHAKNLASRETVDGINIERVNYWFKISKGFFAPFFLWRTLRYINNTDVVLLNEPTIEGLGVAVIARLLRKKLIALYQCRLDLGQGFLAVLLSKIVNFIVFLQLFFCHKIVVHSQDYAQSVGLSVFKKRLVYIRPPVAQRPVNQNFYHALLKEKSETKWIGFCGRMSREKGIEYLVEAYKIIGRFKELALIFAGPYGGEVAGEGKYYLAVKKRLETEKIPHQFLGKLEDDELGAFYKAIDLLVLPSYNSTEAFGMSQVEAMLLATPVVAADLPGVRVPITLTGMGYLFQPQDPAGLADMIEKVLEQKNLVTQDKISRAVKLFDESTTYKRWEGLLSQLIKD